MEYDMGRRRVTGELLSLSESLQLSLHDDDDFAIFLLGLPPVPPSSFLESFCNIFTFVTGSLKRWIGCVFGFSQSFLRLS